MTSPSSPLMTCAEFQASVSDYIEERGLSAAERRAADVHLTGCSGCAALLADLRDIVRQAGELAPLSPSRDLWSGIETRIEAPVVELPTVATARGLSEAPTSQPHATGVPASIARVLGMTAADAPRRRMLRWRRAAIAASLLVTAGATAGTTWLIMSRSAASAAVANTPAPATDGGSTGGFPSDGSARRASQQTAAETFDLEIAGLRKLMDMRRNEMDPMTVGIVEKNLKLIDRAIAESKAALKADPANAFLLDRLTHAYDTKLTLMRDIATRAPRS